MTRGIEAETDQRGSISALRVSVVFLTKGLGYVRPDPPAVNEE